jgi:8-oxo-dGTP pyrophosphatase MutT (NUDIX family)
MGAGILPLAIYKGTLFMLLGQERHNNLWCDFGGSTIKGEKPFKTAIREGYEELNGFLGDENELEEKVLDGLITSISFDKYTSYIFKIGYDKNLPLYFSNVNRFAETNLKESIENNENGLFEKKQILWVSLNQLKINKSKIQIREHYKPILYSIFKNEEFIIKLMAKN